MINNEATTHEKPRTAGVQVEQITRLTTQGNIMRVLGVSKCSISSSLFFSKEERMAFKYWSLFRYNEEVSRGIMHTEEYKSKMEKLNKQYAAEIKET